MLRGSNTAANTSANSEPAEMPSDETIDLDAVTRTLIEAIPGAAFIACADGTVLYANAPGRRMLGAHRASTMSELAGAISANESSLNDHAWKVKRVTSDPRHFLVMHRDGPARATNRLTAAVTQWKLSRRQADVLALLLEGHPNASIAMILGIAVRTVEVHVSALLDRVQVENRSALVARVLGG